jgi:putative peptide zinc metalloprotease protein
MHAQRHRVLTVGGSIAATVLLLVFAVPMPFATGTEGVAWPPRDAEVRAGAAGVVTRLLAPAGSTVRPGDPLLELSNPALPLTVTAREAEYREVAARYQAVLATDPLEAATIATQLASARASLELARQQQAELVVRSRAAGRFVLPSPEDLPGRYLKQGDTVAWVADTQAGTIIAVVSQDDIGLVRERTRRIAVRLAEDPGQELTATIRRQVPAGGERLPSPALGSAGGGRFAVDPTDPDQTRTLDKVFQVELAIAEPMARLGGRAYILFEHGREPLGVQWYRRVRQLFLRRFDA